MFRQYYVEWLFFGAFSFYSLLDGWNTLLLLWAGLVYEANPLLNYVLICFGGCGMFVYKIGFNVIIGIMLYRSQRRRFNAAVCDR